MMAMTVCLTIATYGLESNDDNNDDEFESDCCDANIPFRDKYHLMQCMLQGEHDTATNYNYAIYSQGRARIIDLALVSCGYIVLVKKQLDSPNHIFSKRECSRYTQSHTECDYLRQEMVSRGC